MHWDSLTLVRHGQSVGNAALVRAVAAGAEVVDNLQRDPDTPLSDLGRAQAAALGSRLAALPASQGPTVVLSSPYLRAQETAEIALKQLGSPPVRLDERLRDREVGALYGLTALGMERRFPTEHARKQALGKFYYRPPGGESWTDVALRLRSVLGDLEREYTGERLLVVAHDAVVVLVRYILEGHTEEEILEIEKTPVANCSVTRWQVRDGRPVLEVYNDITHLAGVSAGE